MRRTILTFFTAKEAAEKYLEHLRFTDKELPALQELFPNPSSGAKEIAKFHAQLCDTMDQNGIAFRGIKVVAPNCDPAKVLRATDPLCVPVFDSFFGEDVFSAKQYRLQYVEGGICFTIGGELDANATPKAKQFSPAIEVTGTRFPFYPPTLAGFLCDLCSMVRVATGPPARLTKENAGALGSYSFVLVKDGEPVEIGGGKLFMEDPLKAIPLAFDYAKQLGITLTENHLVLCSGLTSRTPAHPGNYTLQWGTYGSAQCAIV